MGRAGIAARTRRRACGGSLIALLWAEAAPTLSKLADFAEPTFAADYATSGRPYVDLTIAGGDLQFPRSTAPATRGHWRKACAFTDNWIRCGSRG